MPTIILLRCLSSGASSRLLTMTVAVDCAVAGAILDAMSMSDMATADNQIMDTRTRVTLLAIFIG